MLGGLTIQNPKVMTLDLVESQTGILASIVGGSRGDLTSISAIIALLGGKKVSQKSTQQTSTFIAEFGLPIEYIKSVQYYNKTLTCRIVGRQGIVYLRLEEDGPYYKIIPRAINRQLIKINEGKCSIEEPSMRIIAIVIKLYEEKEQKLKRKPIKDSSSLG